jgi:hypothetical protein
MTTIGGGLRLIYFAYQLRIASMSNNANKQMMKEEEDDRIDDEQLDEYREMVEQLGTFPVSKADCYKHES